MLHGVLLIAESDSRVSCSSQSLTPRCPAHHRVWLHGVLLIIESDATVSGFYRIFFWGVLFTCLLGVMHTAVSDSAVSCSLLSLNLWCSTVPTAESAIFCMPTTESGLSVVESNSSCMVSCTPWSFLELSFNSVAEVSDSTVTSPPRSLICRVSICWFFGIQISRLNQNPLKGQGHDIFDLNFCPERNPPWP